MLSNLPQNMSEIDSAPGMGTEDDSQKKKGKKGKKNKKDEEEKKEELSDDDDADKKKKKKDKKKKKKKDTGVAFDSEDVQESIEGLQETYEEQFKAGASLEDLVQTLDDILMTLDSPSDSLKLYIVFKSTLGENILKDWPRASPLIKHLVDADEFGVQHLITNLSLYFIDAYPDQVKASSTIFKKCIDTELIS